MPTFKHEIEIAVLIETVSRHQSNQDAQQKPLSSTRKRIEIDHIVVGNHKQSKIFRILVGHIAEFAIHNSPVPVNIIR
jgi:nucleotide-binding universal stress UspA family protein